MKAKLEFNLPEEQREFDLMLKGLSAHVCLEEILGMFRKWLKYDDLAEFENDADEFAMDLPMVLHRVRDRMLEVIEENGIEL